MISLVRAICSDHTFIIALEFFENMLKADEPSQYFYECIP